MMLPLLLASLITAAAPVAAVAPGYTPTLIPRPCEPVSKVLVIEPCTDGTGCEVWRWVEPEKVPAGYDLF